ncbi:MAG: PDZ domain-containing protein, partial [Alphaproteobacteria bacterium]
ESEGVIVLRVARRSFARRFGVRRHDLILAVNGEDAPSVEALKRLLSHRAGAWRIKLRRGKRVIQMVVDG